MHGQSDWPYVLCASCADHNDGRWEPAHWRDTIGLWAFVALGCVAWAIVFWWIVQ